MNKEKGIKKIYFYITLLIACISLGGNVYDWVYAKGQRDAENKAMKEEIQEHNTNLRSLMMKQIPYIVRNQEESLSNLTKILKHLGLTYESFPNLNLEKQDGGK